MTEKAPLDPRLLKLVSAFAKADAIEDHERWLKGQPPLTADARLPAEKGSRKKGGAKVILNWQSVPQAKRTRP